MPYKMLRCGAVCGPLLLLVPQLRVEAAPTIFECPAAIQEHSIHLSDTEPGWTPFIAMPMYLHAAAPMYGPPEMLGDLADFTERRQKNEWSYTYSLAGEFPQGRWLQCTYGEYNQLTLSKKLPGDITQCTFTYRKGEHAGQNDIKIICK